MTKLMSLGQAARLLGISQENVLKLAHRGNIPVPDGLLRAVDVNRMYVAIQIAREKMRENM